MIRQQGITFIEVLIGCVLSILVIICFYQLEIKTAQFIEQNEQDYAQTLTEQNTYEQEMAKDDGS